MSVPSLKQNKNVAIAVAFAVECYYFKHFSLTHYKPHIFFFIFSFSKRFNNYYNYNNNNQTVTMACTLSLRPNRLSPGSPFLRPPPLPPLFPKPIAAEPWRAAAPRIQCRRRTVAPVHAGSRADDSAPFEMSVENALKLLGVSEGASFDDILRAKNVILANCKDDQDAVAQVEFSSVSLFRSNFRYENQIHIALAC